MLYFGFLRGLVYRFLREFVSDQHIPVRRETRGLITILV